MPSIRDPKPKGPGRPPALDETKREVLVALVRAGWTKTRAARYVGVSPQTVKNTGERDPDFAARLDRAEARLQADHLENLAAASGRSWRASAWALERLAPDRFGRADLILAAKRIVAEEVDDAKLRVRLLSRLTDLAA